ncbi:hypothetical protein SNEBB_004464 [Seison nebaliae]|nr:hypothetical protein SNEBB_004464 [Seison nebaliae]
MFDNCCDIRHLERCPLNRKFKACFPGRSIVETDRGNIQINKLKIGNKIKVIDRHGQIMFTPIIGWLHRNQNSMGFFQEIEAIRMTNETINFRISPKHLIAFWNKKSRRIKIKPAKNLCLDDELILAKDTEERVRIGKITQSMDHGLFAPLTDAGLMNINGVIVSCYSDVKSHNLAHKILAPLRHSKLLANKLNKKGINSFAYFLDKVFNSLN